MAIANQQDWRAAVQHVIDDWNGRYIVTSPDVDGILSALAVSQLTGASLAGLYTTSWYLGFDDTSRDDARDALWLDHDISQPGIRCMGQHLINHSVNDLLPRRHEVSFNPNMFYGQAYPDSFKGRAGRARDKYPFATIHFLLSALGLEEPQRGTTAYHLLAHADGTWGCCLDYPHNTEIWYHLMFGENDSVLTDLVVGDYCGDAGNLARHTGLVELLRESGIDRRRAREGQNTAIPEAWQNLQGHQGVGYRKRNNPNDWLPRFNQIMALVSDLTGWPMQLPQEITMSIQGRVETPYPNSIREGEFDQYMLDEQIFSHAIKSFRMIRYTTDLVI